MGEAAGSQYLVVARDRADLPEYFREQAAVDRVDLVGLLREPDQLDEAVDWYDEAVDWYDKPEMLQVTVNNPSELWMRRDHKHDLAFRPLETGIKDVDMVPSLSAQNMECIRIGKDFMFEHGYIKHDFDVDEWARPEFLEKAAEEVLKEEWERRSRTKLPHGGGLEVEGTRLG